MEHKTRTKAMSWLLSLALVLGLMQGMSMTAYAATWSGEGSQSSPYLISSLADLINLRDSVNAGTEYSGNYFKLTADIDCGTDNWAPIGMEGYDNQYNEVNCYFMGTFDGNGKTITYHVANANDDYKGLFYTIPAGATVKNLSVAGFISGSGSYYGGIAGKNSGTIQNCSSSVSITGSASFYGGIAGINGKGTIDHCVASGVLTKNGSGYAYTAGIAGQNIGSGATVRDCVSLCDISAVNANQSNYAGRVIGRNVNNGTTADCYYLSTANISGDAVNADNATGKTAEELKVIGETAYNAGYTVYAKALGYTPHTHSFTYSVGTGNDANTITATCGSQDGCPLASSNYQATLTISAAGGTYDGTTTYGATVTNNIPAVDGVTVGEIEYYKVSTQGATTGGTKQTGAPTDAGYYYASVTLTGGGNTYPAIKAFTVAPKALTITEATLTARDYAEGNKDVTVSEVTFDNASLTLDTDYTATAVMADDTAGNAKSATVTVTLTNDNYSLAANTYDTTVQINKIAYAGNMTAAANLRGTNGATAEVTLPALPTGASYGAVTNDNTDYFTVGTVAEGKVTVTAAKDFDQATESEAKDFTVAVTGATNYNDYSVTVTITPIFKAEQTITAENVTATYGETGKKVTATTNGNGTLSYAVKSGSDVIDVDAATGALTIKKAGTATVTVTAAGNDDYAEATKDVTVTINKKAITVTADNKSMTVGSTAPELTKTVTGLASSDQAGVLDVSLVCEYDPDTPGTYTIVASGEAEQGNYTVTYVNGTLTISVRSTPSSSSSHDRDDSSDSSSSTPSSTTTTTTTTDTTSNPDASTTDGTATVTTTTNRDGSTTEKTTETATKSGGDGSKTEVKAESTTTTKSNTDGTTTAATTSTETATTTAADGTKTVTETKTEAKETLDKSGNGTVEAKTTETVKDASGKVTATTVTESKGTVETATDGTKTTTTTNTAVTTDAAGNKTTVVTTEKATVTTDGNTGKVVSDESGKVVSVEAKVSETAAESAAKSGETVTLPVTVTAAQSAEDATPVAITVPKAAESVKVEIPVEDVKPGTVAVIVHEDGTEEIVKTSTTSEGGVVLALESGASVKVVDNTKTFNDVDGNEWYAENVAWASSREVMNGVGNNTFAPNEDTNRAMVTQILYNLDDGKASDAVPTFNDVSADDWYADSVSWAVENGIARGEGASFGANDPVTREQLAVMLYNYAGKKGYDVSAKGDISRFTDSGNTSAWASDAMAWAVGVGIINGARDAAGNTLLDPQGNASRAQVTAMTERFCQKATK